MQSFSNILYIATLSTTVNQCFRFQYSSSLINTNEVNEMDNRLTLHVNFDVTTGSLSERLVTVRNSGGGGEFDILLADLPSYIDTRHTLSTDFTNIIFTPTKIDYHTILYVANRAAASL